MRLFSLILLAGATLALAGCGNDPYGNPRGPLESQGGRAIAGAVVGAAAADATDKNMVAGAALGALAGGASCGIPGLPACR